MNQQVITTAPIGFRHRTAVLALGLFAVIAIGVGVAVTALDSGGTATPVQQAAPATPVPPTLQLCGNDPTYLVAAIATMPGEVQARVGATCHPSWPTRSGTSRCTSTRASSLRPTAPRWERS